MHFILHIIVKIVRRYLYYLLSDNKKDYPKKKVFQPLLLKGKGKFSFRKVKFGYESSPFFYSGYIYMESRTKNAQIIIEENVIINNNTYIICEDSLVHIKRDSLIGPNSGIIDSDFHNLSVDRRISGIHSCKPVIIEENVFVGANVKILKGVRIGKNSVIANGSIVTRNIPANVIAGGIPAKIIKQIP